MLGNAPLTLAVAFALVLAIRLVAELARRRP
jgi:hypothetical protein